MSSVKRDAADVILNRVERGEGSLVDLREILRSLKLPQDDLIHENTIHIIYVHLLRCPAQKLCGAQNGVPRSINL